MEKLNFDQPEEKKKKEQSKLSKVGKLAIIGLAGVVVGQSDIISENKKDSELKEVKSKQTEHLGSSYEDLTNNPIAKDPGKIERDQLNSADKEVRL